MQLIHAIAFGIGMLILAYLLFSNGSNVATIISSGVGNKTSPGITGIVTTLQGR